jgi:hypothetical protein
MNEYIAEQKAKTGIVWTFATLEVDHIDFKPTNHHANNLQFLTPKHIIATIACVPAGKSLQVQGAGVQVEPGTNNQ